MKIWEKEYSETNQRCSMRERDGEKREEKTKQNKRKSLYGNSDGGEVTASALVASLIPWAQIMPPQSALFVTCYWLKVTLNRYMEMKTVFNIRTTLGWCSIVCHIVCYSRRDWKYHNSIGQFNVHGTIQQQQQTQKKSRARDFQCYGVTPCSISLNDPRNALYTHNTPYKFKAAQFFWITILSE